MCARLAISNLITQEKLKHLHPSCGKILSDERVNANDDSSFDIMRNLRIENTKKFIMGHLNINSIPNTFEGIMDLDIFLTPNFVMMVMLHPKEKIEPLVGEVLCCTPKKR